MDRAESAKQNVLSTHRRLDKSGMIAEWRRTAISSHCVAFSLFHVRLKFNVILDVPSLLFCEWHHSMFLKVTRCHAVKYTHFLKEWSLVFPSASFRCVSLILRLSGKSITRDFLFWERHKPPRMWVWYIGFLMSRTLFFLDVSNVSGQVDLHLSLDASPR